MSVSPKTELGTFGAFGIKNVKKSPKEVCTYITTLNNYTYQLLILLANAGFTGYVFYLYITFTVYS